MKRARITQRETRAPRECRKPQQYVCRVTDTASACLCVDIGREFTELWHHQQQIRMAVGADAVADARYLGAVIDIAVRGLPHAFRDVSAETGHTVAIDINGPSGGQWTRHREEHRWSLWCGVPAAAMTSLRLNDDTAWKPLFNALSNEEAARAIQIDGRADLGRALLRARSVIV